MVLWFGENNLLYLQRVRLVLLSLSSVVHLLKQWVIPVLLICAEIKILECLIIN